MKIKWGGITSPFEKIITVSGNLVQFSSIADYRELIDNSTEESRQELIKYVGENFRFVSLSQHLKSQVLQSRKNEEVESMTDDFITHLLNEHGMIRIGEYYFRVDLENEVVYVSESEGDVLQTLTGEAEDNVMVFSTSDDVYRYWKQVTPVPPREVKAGAVREFFAGEVVEASIINLLIILGAQGLII